MISGNSGGDSRIPSESGVALRATLGFATQIRQNPTLSDSLPSVPREGEGGLPSHIEQLADRHPGQVSVMQWVPTKTFSPLSPTNVAAFTKYCHNEFVKLLHTTSPTPDSDLRERMKMHPPIAAFAEKYSTLFEKITTRDIATNPKLMQPILYQTFLLEKVNSGEITEEQAKGFVANSAMEAVLSEMVRRGAISPTEAEAARRKS